MTFEFQGNLYTFVKANRDSNGYYNITCERNNFRGISRVMNESDKQIDPYNEIRVIGYCGSNYMREEFNVEERYFDEIEPDEDLLNYIKHIDITYLHGINDAVKEALGETSSEELDLKELI